MTIETIKIMLDALENHTAIKHPQQIHYRDKAIEAGRQAIAEAEKKEQEFPKRFDTHPQPKREWIGLTDAELKDIWLDFDTDMNALKAIEAKLKEKNCL